MKNVTVVLALVTSLAAGCKKENKADPAPAGASKGVEPAPAPTPAPTPPPAPAPAKPADFTVTAEQIYGEFRPQIEAGTADAVRAKYTGKLVQVSGVVVDNSDMIGTWELSLKADANTGKAFLHPAAGATDAFKKLKAGDKPTFMCVSEGWEIGPQFKDCVVR